MLHPPPPPDALATGGVVPEDVGVDSVGTGSATPLGSAMTPFAWPSASFGPPSSIFNCSSDLFMVLEYCL